MIDYTETKSEQNINLIRSLQLLYKWQVEISWNNNDKLLTTIFGDIMPLSTMCGTYYYIAIEPDIQHSSTFQYVFNF